MEFQTLLPVSYLSSSEPRNIFEHADNLTQTDMQLEHILLSRFLTKKVIDDWKANVNIPILPEAFLTFASKSCGPSKAAN